MSNFRRRLIQSVKGKRRQELTSLISTGTQFIDTLEYGDNNTRLVMEFEELEANTIPYWYYGARGYNYQDKAFCLATSEQNAVRKMTVNYANTGGAFVAITPQVGQRYKVEQDENELFVNGELRLTLEQQVFTTPTTMLLFASRNNNVVSNKCKMKLYYCKIYKNGGLVKDFVPILDEEGIACLFDRVNERYYYNEGAGEFVAGEIKEEYIHDGLVLCLDGYDGPNGDVWVDRSEKANDGILINTNNGIIYDERERGYSFKNNEDYIETVNNLGLGSNPDVTFEFVYRWYGWQTNQMIGGLCTIGDLSVRNGHSLTVYHSKSNGVIKRGLASVNALVGTGSFLKQEKTNYTVVKRAGDLISDHVFMYENGQKIENDLVLQTASMDLPDTPIQIGRSWQNGGQNRTFNGMIYCVRVYNKVLTEEEIKHNYEADCKRFCLDYIQDGLVVHLDGYDAPINNVWTDEKNGFQAKFNGNFSYSEVSHCYGFDGTGYGVLAGLKVKFPCTLEIVLKPIIESEMVVFADSDSKMALGIKNHTLIGVCGSDELVDKEPTASVHDVDYVDCVRQYVVVYDGSGVGYYIDGEWRGVGAKDFIVNTENGLIGKSSDGKGFVGSVYDLRVYDRALTEEEIKHNYEVDRLRYEMTKEAIILNGENFEQGTFFAETGLSTQSNSRLRSKEYIDVMAGTYVIKCEVGLLWNFFIYNVDGSYNMTETPSVWYDGNTFTFTGDRKVRVLLRSSTNSVILPEDVTGFEMRKEG